MIVSDPVAHRTSETAAPLENEKVHPTYQPDGTKSHELTTADRRSTSEHNLTHGRISSQHKLSGMPEVQATPTDAAEKKDGGADCQSERLPTVKQNTTIEREEPTDGGSEPGEAEADSITPEDRLRWIKRQAVARVRGRCASRRRPTDGLSNERSSNTADASLFQQKDEEPDEGWESEAEELDLEEEGYSDDAEEHSTVDARLEVTENLKKKGNDLFKNCDYMAAIEMYTDALKCCPTLPLGAVLLGNRAACYLLMKKYEDVIADCTDAVELDPAYVKAYLRRFRANEALEKWHDALTDLKKAFEIDPSLRPGYAAVFQKIERESQEQFEREKKEMMDKLKTFGNWALGKVGLSIDNFKLEQNPETGAYNISFQNNQS